VLVVAPPGTGPVLCETLRGIRPHWEVLTVASPSGAQALCSVLEIDVVVIDGGMADAPELLRGLAVEQPGIGRVALAGDPPELVALAAHQVLPHAPAAYPLVRSVAAARAEAARTQVDPVERVVADLDTLPCAPLVWTRLRTMLADPDCDALHLADLIHHDVAATAAVLRIANNPGLRRAEPATDVAEAIRLLGVRTISSALLAPQALAALRHVRPLPGLRVHEISLHGYACGVVARALLEDPQQAAQPLRPACCRTSAGSPWRCAGPGRTAAPCPKPHGRSARCTRWSAPCWASTTPQWGPRCCAAGGCRRG